MRPSTKGQIQVGETVAVILVFATLLIFGLAWWSAASTGGIEAASEQQLRLELLEKTKQVMNLPELHCSTAGVEDRTCLDLYRMRAFADNAADGGILEDSMRANYYGYRIAVATLYPDLEGSVTLLDYKPPNEDGAVSVAVPVIVEDPLTHRRAFSMLVITQYGGAV